MVTDIIMWRKSVAIILIIIILILTPVRKAVWGVENKALEKP